MVSSVKILVIEASPMCWDYPPSLIQPAATTTSVARTLRANILGETGGFLHLSYHSNCDKVLWKHVWIQAGKMSLASVSLDFGH